MTGHDRLPALMTRQMTCRLAPDVNSSLGVPDGFQKSRFEDGVQDLGFHEE